jgi:hypothetical protein
MSRAVWRRLVATRVTLAVVIVMAVVSRAWGVFLAAVGLYAGLMAWAWWRA